MCESSFVDKVFVITGYPEYTYVERELVDTNMTTLLKDRGAHIYLHGMSKSGKSSLWKQYLSDGSYLQPIRVNGRTQLDKLYNDIIRKSESYYDTEIEKSSGEEVGSSLTGSGIFKSGLTAEVKALKKSAETLKSMRLGEIDYNINLLIECLSNKKPRIIIEDFHFLQNNLIEELAEDLKALSDEKIQVIMVGVENKTEVIVEAVGDLEERLLDIELGYFEDEYLKLIIEKGSKELNFELSNEILNEIVALSSNKAFVTQNICRSICEVKKISDRCNKHVVIDDYEVFEKACKNIAFRYKTKWEKIIHLIGQHEHGNAKNNTYKWLLKFLSEKQIERHGMPLSQVVSNVKAMGGSGIPDPSIRSCVTQLPKMIKKHGYDEVIKYENKTLFVDDRFQFYLKWSNGITDKYICKL